MASRSGVRMNWGGFDRGLARLANGLADRRELLESCAEALLSGTIRRFDSQSAPDGTPWEDTRRGGSILSNTGRLRDSISAAVSGDTVFVGTNLLYAPTHQYGATIKAKNGGRLRFRGAGGRWYAPKEVTIPARPYLGMSREDWDEVQATINEFVRRAMTGS